MSWLHKWIKIFLNFSILHCKHNTAQECKETVKTCCVPVFFYQAELRFKTRYFLQGISQVVSQAVQSLKSFFYLWRKFGYTYDSMWRETSVCIIFCFFFGNIQFLWQYYSQNACVKHGKSLQKITTKECYNQTLIILLSHQTKNKKRYHDAVQELHSPQAQLMKVMFKELGILIKACYDWSAL